MIVTGFMLWNPVATARFLPGQWIPAAQVVHGGEALLAILAVLVWHFYSVHLRQLQPGDVHRPDDRARDGARAPARARADQGGDGAPAPTTPRALARRQKVFLPVAGVVAALLLAGIFWFVTFEQTAIDDACADPTRRLVRVGSAHLARHPEGARLATRPRDPPASLRPGADSSSPSPGRPRGRAARPDGLSAVVPASSVLGGAEHPPAPVAGLWRRSRAHRYANTIA